MRRSSHTLSTPDGVCVSLELYGEAGQGTAVVVCPGFFQSKETPTFQRMSQALAGNCDVLAMDFRGHGRSGGLYTFSAREGADLEAVCTEASLHAIREVLQQSAGREEASDAALIITMAHFEQALAEWATRARPA